jgi:hypothetical protein
MLQRSIPLLTAIVVLSWSQVSHARLNGIESGGCNGCHRGGATPTVTITADSMMITAGQKVTITVGISTTNGTAGGFFIPKPESGAFTATAGTKLWPDGGITHSAPGRATGNQVIFQVIWTAPSQPTMGGADFPVYAISANGNGSNAGDAEGNVFLSLAYGCGAGTKYYADRDGDNYGSEDSGWTQNCSPPMYYAAQAGDCNDNDPKVHPGGAEICDGKDNNCDGVVDENLAAVVLCEDKDGDGHGIQGAATHTGCTPNLKGFGACDGDCNDNDATVHPGATEVCNNKDDNCDGKIDEDARPTCGEGWCRRYGASCASPEICTPGQPRKELCNLFDDDCDGVIDNGTDLELCGEGSGCREGYCVPIDGSPGGTGGSNSPTTGGGPTTGGATSTGAAGQGAQPPDTGGVACAMRTRGSRGGSGMVACLFALGWAARRRLAPGARGEKRRLSRTSHETPRAPAQATLPDRSFSRVSDR